MDEENLNTPPVPETPEQPVEEPITEPTPKEPVSETPVEEPVETPTEPLDEPTPEEPIEEQPAPEPSAEAPAEAEPVTETPLEAPVDEVSTEKAPKEAPAEETPAETPAEPTETTNPDLVAKAGSETPAEPAPVFPIETNPQPKTKKPLIIAMIALFVLALGGTGVWYFLLRDNGAKPVTPVQNDQEPITPLEQSEIDKLTLRSNELSDFDLAFLHLENKAQNLIYSPLSIKYALAMLSDASAGESKTQIESLIGNYQPKAYLNSANRSLANAMFIRTDFSEQVKADYKSTLESKYYASVVLDSFTSPDNANKWVEDKTLGIIKNAFSQDTLNSETDYMLINALAIDMNWVNRIQCAVSEETDKVSNIYYTVKYSHENYSDSVTCLSSKKYDTITFNEKGDTESATIGVSANRYNIIEELGETHIRDTVRPEYINYLNDYISKEQDWLSETESEESKETARERIEEAQNSLANPEVYLNEYISELSSNYGNVKYSTDFYFLDGSQEKVFAKDLREYDGATLQYVGIMPKSGSLNSYINSLTAEKTSSLIANLKDTSNINSYKEGVVTKITGSIPFFKFDFNMTSFMNNLQSLGITDIFSTSDANLSGMLNYDETASNKPYISSAIHKANIDFSNDGIKASAVTGFGGWGAGGPDFDYEWDVPVEEIDLTFDKPFLFLIRDKGTGEVWFVGTVYEGNIAS